MKPLKIAVVGGECTGKTTLCQALAARLPGLWVPEYVREFVERRGRPPRETEQAAVVATQVEREEAALQAARRQGIRWVACDSAPIMTAIYSSLYFDDESLFAVATPHHATYACTLLTDIDLPWEADGAQRDSPAVRLQAHERIQVWLDENAIPFCLVSGTAEARVASAVAAVRAVESAAR